MRLLQSRRALTGLALFVCLLASGWAWMQVVPADVSGTYVRIVNSVDRDLVCAATNGVEPGGMRVTGSTVEFARGTCEIALREEWSEESTEGPSITVELGLICGPDPAGPNGLSSTLHLYEGRAELTTYIANGSGYTPAHSAFLGCQHDVDPYKGSLDSDRPNTSSARHDRY